MLLVFVFGRVLTTSGMMPVQYKSMLLPGIIALSMLLAGIQAVAMPLISEFQFTKEIEDRLLAPIENRVGGDREGVRRNDSGAGRGARRAAGRLAADRQGRRPAPRPSRSSSSRSALLVALLSSAIGLTLGCAIGQTQIGLMF